MRTSQLPPADRGPGRPDGPDADGPDADGPSWAGPGRPASGRPASGPGEFGPWAGGPDLAGEFLGRLGDEIDDRVAEVLPEILREQPGRRPGPNLALAAFGLLAALAATLVLRDSVAAVCVIWPSAAVVGLAAALAGRRRP
ncbi:MAG: hypothetical protein ACRDRJ_32625 [Streptosporangiaceae bacterium]